MSNKCMNWAIQEYNPGDQLLKLVVMLLADQADDDGYVFLSQQRIAARAGCSERTIRRAVAELESAGTLHVIRKKLGTNKSRNAYYLGVPWLSQKVTADKLSYVISGGAPVNLTCDIGRPCPVTQDRAVSYYPIENPSLPGTAGNSNTGVTAGSVTEAGNVLPVERWAASGEALDVLRDIDRIPQEFINRSEIDFHAYYAGADERLHRTAAAWDARFKDSVRRRWSLYRKDWLKFGPKILEKQTGEGWANDERR